MSLHRALYKCKTDRAHKICANFLIVYSEKYFDSLFFFFKYFSSESNNFNGSI